MINREELLTFLNNVTDNSEVRLRTYSGRGMYGKVCLGIATDDINTFMTGCFDTLVNYFPFDNKEDEYRVNELLADLSNLFRRMCSDQLGRGMIYYFPQFEVESSEIVSKNSSDEYWDQ